MDVNFEKRLRNSTASVLLSPNKLMRSSRNLFSVPKERNDEEPHMHYDQFAKPSMSPNASPSLYRKGIGNRRSSPGSPLTRSPMASPVKERYGDRFIPSRTGNNWETNFNMISDKGIVGNKKATRDASDGSKDYSLLVYSSLLKNEILGTSIEDFKDAAAYANSPIIGNSNSNVTSDNNNIQGNAVVNVNGSNIERRGNVGTTGPPGSFTTGTGGIPATSGGSSNSENRNLFSYRARRLNIINEATSPYSLTPVSSKSQKLLRSPRKASRKISKIPFKVLDAPELQDDFYLNLVDWSSQNVLSVGLGACVYLWSACTSQVTRLCDLTSDNDNVTSVSWSERGNLVAVGTHKGYVQVWDVAAAKRVNVLEGHTARVGALAWNGDSLSSGSRDRHILQRDIRTPAIQPERNLVGHRQEVCGLKWSPDNQWLASGGNDNKLFVWSAAGGSGGNNMAAVNTNTAASSTPPIHSFTDHLAAVKAIAWSPHHHGLLASGGGTADRCIRFWNTLTGQAMQSVDTGSQVCNLAWSKHASELVSTHGYSQNQILVWKYPSLVQVAKLTGHSYRVLYLAMSPDGEAIVTGAGDETLRFWNVFSKARSQKEAKSALNLFTSIR